MKIEELLKNLLSYRRNRTLRFPEFVEAFTKRPEDFLHTSSTLLSKAIQHFGFKIVVRSGEPIISYAIFDDIFNHGINAVFGQEFAIKHMVDAIDAAGKETGPNRGLILVGPPASGKTNIIDIMTQALEEYTKEKEVRLYSFFFEFKSKTGARTLEIYSSFNHNPVLLFPITMPRKGETMHPRQELLDFVSARYEERTGKPLVVSTYYKNANLDKSSIDIIQGLLQNPKNREKSLFQILDEYVRIDEIVFSNARAKSVANIDDMRQLRVRSSGLKLSPEDEAILHEHLPGYSLSQYEGAMVASNRGMLHIHDAFSGDDSMSEQDYKPLLMLLGSGKVSVDATQASVDNTVVMTTNLEEMSQLETRLTSSKLMDRVEKVPVNYLLDANAEMDILKRDIAIMKENYQVDPNLLRIAAYYAVMTRLMPPNRTKFPPNWSDKKKRAYNSLTVEKKLFIYAYQAEDPLGTIQKIPHWHPFRNEALKLDLDLGNPESLTDLIKQRGDAVTLHASGLFSNEELSVIDDEFMRLLWQEHYPREGRTGISVRQLQNVMRNTIANSDGRKVHVGTFLSQLKRVIREGREIHHWLSPAEKEVGERPRSLSRSIGRHRLPPGEGDYSDFSGLVRVTQLIYYQIIENEITEATVDRDPSRIEVDLRRYLQYALLANAHENKAFAHIMVPKFTFIHPHSGEKVDQPDLNYMASIEKVAAPERDPLHFRRETAQKFLELQSKGEIVMEEGKNVINSKNDNVLVCFHDMYAAMLSHRKNVDGINAELLRDAFFQRKNDYARYKTYSVETRDLVETILENMINRFGYPESIGLDTVVFALRKQIVDLAKMIR